MTFTDAGYVEDFLPAGGTPSSLTSDLEDPTSSSSGVFGGQVLALQLNVDFSNASLTPGAFGSLIVDGTVTVAQILAAASEALGGAPGTDIAALNAQVTNLNEAFDNCKVSAWAIQHLTP